MANVCWFKSMSTWGKSIFYVRLLIMMIAILGITVAPGVTQAAGVVYDTAAIYNATTDDGVTIKIYHYRPATSEQFTKNGVPVLLFPGILQNSSQYLSSSPDEVAADYSKTTMPDPLPDWAIAKDAHGNPIYQDGEPVLEKYINADHMKIWSLAHYLWVKGYDVWLANYRDTGRDDMRSTGTYKETLTTLDTWGALDAAAAITKVQRLTGKQIYIGGHSTGSFAAYIYLQGCYIDYFGWTNKKLAYQTAFGLGYQPHVKGSAALAANRNAAIKGWIALDPAGRPPLPAALDTNFFWTLVSSRLYLPMDQIAESLMMKVPVSTMAPLMDTVWSKINQWDNGKVGNLFGYINVWYTENMDTYMGDLTARYALSGAAIRTLGQYMDNGLHGVTRESYKNGREHLFTIEAKTPNPGKDGYYYYSENMHLVTVPMVATLSESGALVDPNNVYQDIISKKTPHPLDEWKIFSDTAHFDIAAGRKSPTEVFPMIGAWLDKVEAYYDSP